MPQCRSCGAEIIWCRTEQGKNMPVDLNKRPDGNLVLEDVEGDTIARYVPKGEGEYVSHFSTCGQAADWRKRGD